MRGERTIEPPKDETSIRAGELARRIAGRFSESGVKAIELRADPESEKSNEHELRGKIWHRAEDGKWRDNVSSSSDPSQIDVETEKLAENLREKGFEVKIVE